MRTCPKCQKTYPDDMDFCPRDATALVSAATATQAELDATLAQRFRIVRRLGAGGMGTVFLAEQIAVGNRPVALKVLLRKLLDDPEFLLRFRNEAASTGRIDHPNVVTIYESGQADDGSPYIAMQYLEGESLRTRLKARGALPIEECTAIIQQVARGLSAAHKMGIIHRDLKPDNIFLTRGDEGELAVKVVDFGIAKLRESATHTLTGTVLGTPAYMSFEQASGMRSEELDARSDIYSFGVVAYEMLTGRVPFNSDSPLGYVRKHLSEAPPPFCSVKPGLAAVPQLEHVVMKALAKDREARYASVLDFARQFAEATQRGQAPASDASLPSTKVVTPVVGAVREPPSVVSPASARTTEGPKLKVSPTSPAPPHQEEGRTRPASTPAISGFARAKASTEPKKSRAAVWITFSVFVLLLAVGYVWINRPWSETKAPSENLSASKPTENSASQHAAGQQGGTVTTSPGTSSPTKPTKPAQIIVETSPDANVYLDNVFKGQAGQEGRLVIEGPKPGEHALRVTLAGKKDYGQRTTVVEGRVATVKARLADLLGGMRVHTSPVAQVLLDGSSRGVSDSSGEISIQDVVPGSHELLVTKNGKKDYRQNVTVADGKYVTIDATMEDVEDPAKNEDSAVGAFRKINTALFEFHKRYSTLQAPNSLAALRAMQDESWDKWGLLSKDLASGKSPGYIITYLPGPHHSSVDGLDEGPPYSVVARPIRYGQTGRRSFYTNESGVVRETEEDREPTVKDPPLH